VALSFPPPLPPAPEGTVVDPTVASRYEALKNSPQGLAARNITEAFLENSRSEEVSGRQLTQFDILLNYARSVAVWLDAAAREGGLQQRPPEHGHRRHHTRTETENGRVSSTKALR